ncbi:hypothetical protein A3D80_00275 [Candidatus Roizmanbacteria bacterium RIFCSPHIGHO2_02_FULL_40_13b]|uniref:Uncharacterized protein n=1 Tax=Candidatus Roizmanbacteria bacterium RIFCSPHIGHO2_01_FULL_39_24 TaxID=1802032 RepID=A0A1F7GKC0_9BACT|nr:MAG: hypothetical protein A2799_00445 [Candidatus Roizmanbacteria bacterium RIFCSPHIGHO2_01_FULL_39_24]OGK28071.1 MAG: hypothetical protein A3D80_00275 [Candidatus Roizmanbacteria bacterium RIFCSPHIGHO2_02_FULL_40_13b]OGK49580.1 MAG: hypothetical protein A3A56_04245 [Candidatus Roizmanbacteria bacterium RIFCSPLOWO2_01_FULL_40_32]OGK57024.1 MAG: hypothetical protein A3H83_00880 [Candidatus Roizmanbacteria bacterium RIFCSPLOWO2_02_FULL_39_8]
MTEKNKQMVVIGGIIAVIIVGGLFLVTGMNKNTNKTEEESGLPAGEVIPTVDSSVQVDLTTNAKKTEVVLSVEGMPKGTKTIEYELSYNTERDVPQGTTATPTNVEGKSSFQKKITLGTCSSGTCVYHKVVGPIKLNLIFAGSYGKRMFEKEFDL